MAELFSTPGLSLKMCAVEDGKFFIARNIPENDPAYSDNCSITLDKNEKFLLYEQLSQNIEINHRIHGMWFFSPLAQYYYNTQSPNWVWWRLLIVKWMIKGLMK